jgi:hypothetical protein
MENLFNTLVGKTIKSLIIRKREEKQSDGEEYDDEPYLDIEFTDGQIIRIDATYGGYTGNSYDEYPVHIDLNEIAKPQLEKSCQKQEKKE